MANLIKRLKLTLKTDYKVAHLVVLLLLVSLIGFMTLYSAAGKNMFAWSMKQILRFIVGSIILLLIANTDIRLLLRQSYFFYGLCLILLGSIEYMHDIGMRVQRWVSFFSTFNIQPSEVMKPTLLMALSRYFHDSSYDKGIRLSYSLVPFALIVIPFLLVLRQPDLGTAIVLFLTGITVLYIAGIKPHILLIGSSVCIAPALWYCMYAYQLNRVLAFFHPKHDPLGSGYHILQSKIAIGSGGLSGKGFLGSTQGSLQFLPEHHTDFIFAFFCEEWGFIGGVFVLILYGILITYSYLVSFGSYSLYGRLLGVGLSTLFFLHVFINTAMVMGLLPVVGIPLVLMSYGGTALIATMIEFGLLLSIALHQKVRVGRPGKIF